MRTLMMGALLALAGAGSADHARAQGSLSDDAVFEYRYNDASVPPEYHRSYTLTIRRDEVRVVIDSYGDVLHDVIRPVSATAWQALVDVDLGALPKPVDLDPGCAGGTSRALRVHDAGETVVDVEVSACGDQGGDVAAAIDRVVEPVIAGIDDWEQLLQTGDMQPQVPSSSVVEETTITTVEPTATPSTLIEIMTINVDDLGLEGEMAGIVVPMQAGDDILLTVPVGTVFELAVPGPDLEAEELPSDRVLAPIDTDFIDDGAADEHACGSTGTTAITMYARSEGTETVQVVTDDGELFAVVQVIVVAALAPSTDLAATVATGMTAPSGSQPCRPVESTS